MEYYINDDDTEIYIHIFLNVTVNYYPNKNTQNSHTCSSRSHEHILNANTLFNTIWLLEAQTHQTPPTQKTQPQQYNLQTLI